MSNRLYKIAMPLALVLLLGLGRSVLALPEDPSLSPLAEANAHKWLDFLGYRGEVRLLALAGCMLIGLIDLAAQKRFLAAAILFAVIVIQSILGIAFPGLCILVDTEWSKDDSARFAYVHAIQAADLMLDLILAITPVMIAIARKQPKKFKLFTIIGGLITLIFPFMWAVGLHFAFARPPADKGSEANTTNDLKSSGT